MCELRMSHKWVCWKCDKKVLSLFVNIRVCIRVRGLHLVFGLAKRIVTSRRRWAPFCVPCSMANVSSDQDTNKIRDPKGRRRAFSVKQNDGPITQNNILDVCQDYIVYISFVDCTNHIQHISALSIEVKSSCFSLFFWFQSMTSRRQASGEARFGAG